MGDPSLPDLPVAPVDHVTRRFARFMHVEATSGIVLLACTAIALIAANTALAEPYARLWEIRVRVGIGAFELDESLGLAAGFLCGIGFTMAIFVASLAFSGESLIAAKAGVLLGSFAAAVIGAALLRAWLPRKE